MGMVGVRPFDRNSVVGEAKGAFVWAVTWASDADEYKRSVDSLFRGLGLFITEVESLEPVSTRLEREELSEELDDLVEKAQDNPDAVIYGTFHQWLRDDS